MLFIKGTSLKSVQVEERPKFKFARDEKRMEQVAQ
jgi:hypothetical protein